MSFSAEGKLAFMVFLCAALIAGAVMIKDSNNPQSGITGLAIDGSPTAANQPPQWSYGTSSFLSEQGKPLVLALDKLFSDPEGAPLAYTAVGADNLAISLQDGELTIAPEQRFVGERVVSITASDGKNTAVHLVKIEAGGAR